MNEVIIPPHDIQTIIEKTASYVAKSLAGAQFESKLRDTEGSNPKFSFLLPNDAYRAYYLERVRAYREGTADDEISKKLVADEASNAGSSRDQVRPEEPGPLDFMYDHGTLELAVLDRIKLVAIYVAIGGKSLLQKLRNREPASEGSLSFIFESSPNFLLFASLVSQYKIIADAAKCANHPERVKLGEWAKSVEPIKKAITGRLEYNAFVEAEKLEREGKEAKEREAYAAIDWHDYVIVEAVLLNPMDETQLPEPLSLKDLEFAEFAAKKADLLNLSQTNAKRGSDSPSKKPVKKVKV